jgi:hypothetical protein
MNDGLPAQLSILGLKLLKDAYADLLQCDKDVRAIGFSANRLPSIIGAGAIDRSLAGQDRLFASSPLFKLDFFEQQIDRESAQPKVLKLQFGHNFVLSKLPLESGNLPRFCHRRRSAPPMQGHRTDAQHARDLVLQHSLRGQIARLDNLRHDLRPRVLSSKRHGCAPAEGRPRTSGRFSQHLRQSVSGAAWSPGWPKNATKLGDPSTLRIGLPDPPRRCDETECTV